MSTKRRTRRRSADNSESRQLSEADILGAALRLIRRDGADKLSMRLLATELGVTPMAIYHYMPSKAALVQRLGDSVLGDVPRPEPSGTRWAQEFKTYALDGWQRLAAHPGLSDLMLKQPPTLLQRELIRYGASILIAGGVDEHSAVMAITTYNMFFHGVMSTQAQLGRLRRTRKNDRFHDYLNKLDFRALVEYETDLLIAGLRAQKHGEDRAPRAARRPVDRASGSS